MRVHRDILLTKLFAVNHVTKAPGSISQADHVLFVGDYLMAYNYESCIKTNSPIPEFTGAVQSKLLAQAIQKFSDGDIEIKVDESKIYFIQGRRRVGVVYEKEILVPYMDVEDPGEWGDLPEFFGDAIQSVLPACDTNDGDRDILNCVHFRQDKIEATNGYCLIQNNTGTGLEKDFLVRKETAKILAEMGLIQISVTENWVHFFTSSADTVSVRMYLEEFPNMDQLLSGFNPICSFDVPPALLGAAGAAQLFDENKNVWMTLGNSKIIVEGEGPYGSFRETIKTEYTGDKLQFGVSFMYLKHIVENKNVEISQNMCLRTQGHDHVFMTTLILEKDSV